MSRARSLVKERDAGAVAAPTPAITALVRAGIDHRVHSYEHDPAVESYGDEAVAAMGVEAGRVFKTLIASTGTGLVVAVVPVPAMLDVKALASAIGAKRVEMADPPAAERSTGYLVGAISPIGQKRPLDHRPRRVRARMGDDLLQRRPARARARAGAASAARRHRWEDRLDRRESGSDASRAADQTSADVERDDDDEEANSHRLTARDDDDDGREHQDGREQHGKVAIHCVSV